MGVGLTTKYSILFYSIAYVLPLLSNNYIQICVSLFIVGVSSGFTDISVNALVSTLEKKENKNFMSASHGFFSLGGVIGAGLGSVLMLVFVDGLWHMVSVALLVILVNIILSKHYSSITEEDFIPPITESKFHYIGPLLGLAILAFITMFHEGAVEHWSNLYLYDVVGVSENMAGFGFIAFSLCMTLGRFLGDGISQRIGSLKIIQYGCALAFAAYFLIISSHLILAVIGFGIVGLGLSVIIPEIYRLAGKTEGVTASTGISVVSGIGYMGFLVGPVLLGLISNWTDLMGSYIFLTVLIGVAFVLTFYYLSRQYRKS
ncbi:MAG: MFS transporter [Saprospiraceae bacterium]|nr:MFS transporter [Saprospiraceae bacterium]